MKREEKLVKDYLNYCGHTKIQYEPDGNGTTPDFLVDDRIAIEVRRLNQSDNTEGLEEVRIRLKMRVTNLLASLGPPADGQSWFVCYRFSRPMPDWKTLRPKIKDTLKTFMAQTNPQGFDRKLDKGFELRVFRSTNVARTFFVPAGHKDRQSGGWLMPEMEANVKRCIEVKSKQVAKVRHKYSEWWLVLADFIGYCDQTCFRDEVSLSRGNFDKVILLDPDNHKRSFEVPLSST